MLDSSKYDIYLGQIPVKQYRIGIVIMTYNRAAVVKKCFKSLKKTRLKDVIIAIVDDASSEFETVQLVKDFSMKDVPVVKIFVKEHKRFNIHENLGLAADLLFEDYQCEYLTVLDSDTLQKPEWLEKVYELYQLGKEKYESIIVSGFNASISHVPINRYSTYLVKLTVGGINMFFDRALYHNLIRKNLRPYWDSKVCESMAKEASIILVTSPSVIQHIGKTGLFGQGYWRHDFSLDYSLGSRIKYFPSHAYLKLYAAYHYYLRWRVKSS